MKFTLDGVLVSSLTRNGTLSLTDASWISAIFMLAVVRQCRLGYLDEMHVHLSLWKFLIPDFKCQT